MAFILNSSLMLVALGSQKRIYVFSLRVSTHLDIFLSVVTKRNWDCSKCSERKRISKVLDESNGVQADAAKKLNMTWNGFHVKARRLGLLPWKRKAA